MIIREVPNLVSTEVDDLEPSAGRVRGYLASLADAFGLPRRFVQATAQTEGGFDPQTVRAGSLPPYSVLHELEPAARAYGPMRVSGTHIGETVRDAAGKPLQIAEDIETDWKASARAGVALLAQQYQLAELENPFGSLEEWAQQAYSGYSAGTPLRDRYLSTLSDDLPAHPRDRAFLRNYRKAASLTSQDEKQSQARNVQKSSAQERSPNQAPTPPSKSSQTPGSTPLPGPLQRLKESPGDLFMRPSGTHVQRGASSLNLPRGFSLVPSASSAAPPGHSLGNVASFLATPPQLAGGQPSDLTGPIQRLKENAGDIFLEAQPSVTVSRLSVDYGDHVKQDGSRNWRNNNPGNLRYTEWARRRGAIGQDADGFAVFPSVEAGAEAQRALLTSPNYSVLSVEDALRRWTSGDPKALQDAYIKNVVLWTGVDSKTKVSDLSADQLSELQDAMRRQEGWKEGRTIRKKRGNANP